MTEKRKIIIIKKIYITEFEILLVSWPYSQGLNTHNLRTWVSSFATPRQGWKIKNTRGSKNEACVILKQYIHLQYMKTHIIHNTKSNE